MASTTTKLLLVPLARFGDTHLMNDVDVVDDDVLIVEVNVISEFVRVFFWNRHSYMRHR